MRSIFNLILPLVLSSSLFSDPLPQGQKQLPPTPLQSQQQQATPSAAEEYEEEDTGEVDEDIIIQDEEGTDLDEDVHN